MRTLLASVLVTAAFLAPVQAQYNLVVTNLGDSGSTGAGTLREGLLYLQANAPATATITLAVSGTLNLTAPLPYFNATTRLTLQHSFASGRFTIDARAVSGGGPIHGLQVPGPNAIVSAPLTILVTNGIGMEIANQNSRVDDVEIVGGSQFGFHAINADNLVAKRVSVTGTGGIGIFVNGCTNPRFGDAATAQFAFVRGRPQPGFQILGGSGVKLEAFDVAGCTTGVFVSGSNGAQFGTATGPRSSVANCSGTGIYFLNSLGSAPTRSLQRTDLLGNQIGVEIDGGGNHSLFDCVCDANTGRGIGLDSGAANTLVEGFTCKNTGNGSGLGVYVGTVSSVRVKNCVLGPNNQNGFSTFGSGLATGVVVEGGSARTNTAFGVRAELVQGLVVDGVDASDNVGGGIYVLDSATLTVRNCTVRNNLGGGFSGTRCPNAILGPGNVVEDSAATGISLDSCTDTVITGNPSVSRNRFMGIYVLRCQRVTVKTTTLVANNALGLSILSSDDCVLGPGNVVTATTGTGIRAEICRSILIDASQVTKSSGTGIVLIFGSGTPIVRSTLVAENRDSGISVRLNPPTDIVCCTVVRNYRGVYANGPYQSGSTQVRIKSCILRGQTLDDYGTFDPFGVTLPTYSFIQNPPGTGTNSALDPLFAQEAAGDWRLQATSPAIDAVDPAVVWPSGALDSTGQPRVFGARADSGSWERQPSGQVLTFFPDAMPKPGGQVGFTLQWQTSQAGKASILLFSLTGPGVLPLFGLNVPLALDQWMVTSLSFAPPQHVDTVRFGIPPTGTVTGSIDYGGGFLPLLPAQYYPLRIWAAGLTVDFSTGLGGQLSNLSWFEIR